MPMSSPRTWLIAYDIRDARRLARVHRYLKTEAVPVQYSVFVTRCGPHRLGRIRATLEGLIRVNEDDVRIYHVPDDPEVSTLGRQGLPEGIRLLAGAEPSRMPFTAPSEALEFGAQPPRGSDS